LKSQQGIDMLERVRTICGSWPEVEELVDGFGHNVFKVKGKSFVIMGENEGPPGLSFKSDKNNNICFSKRAAMSKRRISDITDGFRLIKRQLPIGTRWLV
jgi:hypothetical protein